MELKIKRQLTVFEWLQLPQEVRNLFIKWFNIPRTGGAIVTGNVVQSDGYTQQDLSTVSLESLQAFLHTDDDHWDNLLQLTINNMESYVQSNNITAQPTSESQSASTGVEQRTTGKKRGRPKIKKAT